MAYAGEFIDRFKLIRRPKWNKKERRRLGRRHEPIKVIQVAQGLITMNGKERFISKSSAIIKSIFDAQSGYLHLFTENGKQYKVRYKEEVE